MVQLGLGGENFTPPPPIFRPPKKVSTFRPSPPTSIPPPGRLISTSLPFLPTLTPPSGVPY